jgi:2,4-dienoyl-CoA reductase-like NADH-dependent reductase (Old Yellow Enzyme family)
VTSTAVRSPNRQRLTLEIVEAIASAWTADRILANPDLSARFADDLPLDTPDHATFDSPGAKGYVDYPRWEPRATVVASPEIHRKELA